MVHYISTYYEYKNRNVSTAAKGFINVVRDLNPELLERKYRGRNFTEGMVVVEKSKRVVTEIDGIELLGIDGTTRVLTDEDFKMIRKLRRKREEELAVEEEERRNGMVEEMKEGDMGEEMEVEDSDEEDEEGYEDEDGEELEFEDEEGYEDEE